MQNLNKCPIETALDYLRNKWSFEIIRDLFMGKKRFKDFLKANPSLSSKVLSDRLKELCEKEIIRREIIDDFPVTTEYHLTEKGRGLNRVLYELAAFACNCEVMDGRHSKICTSKALGFLKKVFDIED